ncbi:MAG: TauD/TfdA family dioxygenase [Burkholderiales bacterium]
MPVANDPFDLGNDRAYRAWRDAKLEGYPSSLDEVSIDVDDPRDLTEAERKALAGALGRSNFAIYRGRVHGEGKDVPRELGRQLGLTALDRNWLADDDGISSITVAARSIRGDFIPYTNRAISWHTDGYYNPAASRVRAVILHCVKPAAAGGSNRLLDHEVAYMMLRDDDPAHVAALMREDAMTIPARLEQGREVRAAQSGPVFSVDPATGALHMRYTARTRSIAWSDDPAVTAAVARLERLLEAPSSPVHAITLGPGMGIVGNNVLHDRSGFTDRPQEPRLVYRARYHDRIAAGSGWRNG